MRSSWRDANYTNYYVFKYQPYQGKSSVTVHSSKGRCSISGCVIKNVLLHFKLTRSKVSNILKRAEYTKMLAAVQTRAVVIQRILHSSLQRCPHILNALAHNNMQTPPDCELHKNWQVSGAETPRK